MSAVESATEHTSVPVTTRRGGGLVSACGHLFGLSLRRQFFSRQTLVCLTLTVLCALIVFAWTHQSRRTTKKLAEQVLVPTFIGFLVPIFAISYGSSGIGGEREDRTLIYLFIVPIPRAALFLVKSAATMVLVSGWTVLSLMTLCFIAGRYGREVLFLFLPGSALGSLVYAALFLVLGASFRHGTIISLAYWFFLEVLFGAMPGIVKRLTVSYYMKCMIYDAGAELQLGPLGRVSREMFLALPGATAAWVLVAAWAGLMLIGAAVLSRREYAELG